MARLNIFLSDQLLDEIDRHASDEGINRSALIRAVMQKYIDAKRRARKEDEEKRKKMQEACRRMDALAKKLGDWDPQGTIRQFRNRNLRGSS